LFACPEDPEPVLFLEMYIKNGKSERIKQTLDGNREDIKIRNLHVPQPQPDDASDDPESKTQNSDKSSDFADYVTPSESSDEDKEEIIRNFTYRRDLEYNPIEDITGILTGVGPANAKKGEKKISTTMKPKAGTTSGATKPRLSATNFNPKTTTTKAGTKTKTITSSKTGTAKVPPVKKI
jgi:hypothetical protein